MVGESIQFVTQGLQQQKQQKAISRNRSTFVNIME